MVWRFDLISSFLHGIFPEDSILDGLAEWPASTTRKEWFAITRGLIQQTIAEMDLDPAALAEVEEARDISLDKRLEMYAESGDKPPVFTFTHTS